MAVDYESEELLSQYLVFHFGDAAQQFPHNFGGSDGLFFPSRCAELALRHHGEINPHSRALDLGCAVGGSAFALSSTFREIVAIDYSAAFIDAAKRIAALGKLSARLHQEGSLYEDIEVALPPNALPENILFQQGDAQALPANLGEFDLVLACNLICRLNEPGALLRTLPRLVRPGGTLLITTPLTWMEAYTPPERWLSQPQTNGLSALETSLAPAFQRIAVEDMPFLIREHRRKFQYSIAQASTWRRV